jgi:hypothetical protein
MRCSYCGNLNHDYATFCARCGRNLVEQPTGRPPLARPQIPPQPQTPPTSASRAPAYPPSSRPASSGRDSRNSPQFPASPVSRRTPVPPFKETIDQFASVTTPVPAAPEAPAHFPPHTVEQLHALEPGALTYTKIDEDTAPGGKKIVHIMFTRCTHWQQVATLLSACNALQNEKFSTLIIRGSYDQKPYLYSFNNGQLVFDRGVRLGSQILNRYQIETGTGFEGEAVRIVLTE